MSMFAQELLALLDAGMELMEALEILGGRSKDVMSAQILERLIHAISEGKTLSSAMTAASKFPPLFIATIKSGENTGNLPDSLRRYIHYYRQVNSLKEKIVLCLRLSTDTNHGWWIGCGISPNLCSAKVQSSLR